MQKRILVVEDEDYIRKLLVELLGDDFDIVQAVDGKEALGKYIALKPDLVLMDILMPNLDGLSASKDIFAYDKQAKIIVITGIDDDAVEDAARKLGIYAYHLKPFEMEEMLTDVQEVLGLAVN